MEKKMGVTQEKKADNSRNPGMQTGIDHEAECRTEAVPSSAEQYSGNIVLWAQICLCVAALAIVCGLRVSGNQAYGVIRTALRSEIDAAGWYTGGEARNFLKFTQKSFASVREAAREVMAKIQGEPIEETTTKRAAIHHKTAAVPYGYSTEKYRSEEKFCFPLANRHFAINSGYGGRVEPIKGITTEFHGGVDLAASTGDTVCAARDGVVRFAGTHKSYGNYVRIVHPGGVETIYAHMQYLFARSGQCVSAGDSIGTVGQTGAATGPHLHFEILYRGMRYDPTEAVSMAS